MFNKILKKLKGGKKTMRNPKGVAKTGGSPEKVEDQKAIPQNNPEVQVITFEALIANNLDALARMQQEMKDKMMAGFEKLGIKFDELQQETEE